MKRVLICQSEEAKKIDAVDEIRKRMKAGNSLTKKVSVLKVGDNYRSEI